MILSIKRCMHATIKLTDVHGAPNSASHENVLLIAVRTMAGKIQSEAELSKGDLWVFGYGSLMWRAGFGVIGQGPARRRGYRRAFVVYSFGHRGPPEKPGLVLGLDRGGACRGIAFRVSAKQRGDNVDYLRSREQTPNVSREGRR